MSPGRLGAGQPPQLAPREIWLPVQTGLELWVGMERMIDSCHAIGLSSPAVVDNSWGVSTRRALPSTGCFQPLCLPQCPPCAPAAPLPAHLSRFSSLDSPSSRQAPAVVGEWAAHLLSLLPHPSLPALSEVPGSPRSLRGRTHGEGSGAGRGGRLSPWGAPSSCLL